jgi:D-alanine-D-alanine ligase
LHDAAANVASALDNAVIVGVQGTASEILHTLNVEAPDVVFNLCEAPCGKPALEAHAAALFEWLEVPFTGSGSQTLALCRRKDRARAVLASHGVAIPAANVFPAIVKPADEDGSAGISEASICADAAAVEEASRRWPGPVIVEEFLPGREFAVSLWGAEDPDYVSIGETLFQNGLRVNTYASKWNVDSADFANSPLDYRIALDDRLRAEVAAAARQAWRATGARGYLRVDVRCRSDHSPKVLDVNPNPELGPDVGICRAVQEAGWSWQTFVRRQVEWALAERRTTTRN